MNRLQNQLAPAQSEDRGRVQLDEASSSLPQRQDATLRSESARIGNAAVTRAAMMGQALPISNVGDIQMSYGNFAVANSQGAGPTATQQADGEASRQQTLHEAEAIQAKLVAGSRGDSYEQEADRVAGQVMHMSTPTPAVGDQASVDGHIPEERGIAQTKPLAANITPLVQYAPTTSTESFEPGADFKARLDNGGGGSPLPASARAFMEPRFGADFSGVRLHTGSEAAQLNREVSAHAFTHGPDIYLGEGKNDLESGAGKQLLAHELTHTIQQGAAAADDPAVQRSCVSEVSGGLIQRDADNSASSGDFNVPTLDQMYNTALQAARQTGNWQDAAEKLNGFNREDILRRLAQLTADEVAYLHLGALDNRRVGPDSQVAQLTKPGTPRASSAPPASTQTPPVAATAPVNASSPTAASKPISEMTGSEKLIEAYNRARIDAAVREKLLSLISPKALVIAIISFVVVFIASQFTPVGWTADVGLALTAIFVGTALFTAIEHLIRFADARNATSSEQLDHAGAEFAEAVAEIGVDAIILIVTHGVGAGPKGGVPYEGPPPTGFRLAFAEGGGVVPVAANTISVEVAAQLGAKGALATSPLMSRSSGSGGRGRDFEPPARDATGKIHSPPGEDIPRTPAERELAVQSWTKEELQSAAEELEQSIAARKAEQIRLGETSVGPGGQRTGAQHRVRIADEEDLLRRVLKKLSGS